MARHVRRLILWSIGVLLSLATLALLLMALVVWGIDPDRFRGRIERVASDALGRRVELTGPLRWKPGLRFQLESGGGRVANAAGFGPEPLASWKALRLGVALRPLLDRRLVVDRIELQGLHLELARGPGGANWELPALATPAKDTGMTLAVGGLRLRDARVRFRAASGAEWAASRIDADAVLPANLDAPRLSFREIGLRARITGTALQADGIELRLGLPQFDVEPAARRIAAPRWLVQWNDAVASGSLEASAGDAVAATGGLSVQVASLRNLLHTVSVDLPATRDARVFGPLELAAEFSIHGGALAVRNLEAKLDATRVGGEVTLAAMTPPSLRFRLEADAVEADRYRAPEDAPSAPFELPLAQLRALDVVGSLRIRRATVAGAMAREMRLDVE